MAIVSKKKKILRGGVIEDVVFFRGGAFQTSSSLTCRASLFRFLPHSTFHRKCFEEVRVADVTVVNSIVRLQHGA